MKTVKIAASTIQPRHSVESKEYVNTLKASMEISGWTCRPILVISKPVGGGREYEAVTGVHRLAAARNLELDVPCIIVPVEDLSEEQATNVLCGEGHYNYSDLDKIFDAAGFPDAAELMRQEKELGGKRAPIKPTVKPKTESKRARAKRI